jgi:Ser/Thr protein kinase RdoA (MazF antagonist)
VPERVLFQRGHLSVVLGIQMRDGRQVVVKLRPPDDRIAGCVAVQRHLYERGFPCPRPLAGPSPLKDLTATAEVLMPDGSPLRDAGDAHSRLAALLADLVRLAPAPSQVPSLEPTPPWVGWAHLRAGIWPLPDDLDLDLDDHPGPEWIDEAGARVRTRLTRVDAPRVVGHLDWESHNIRWLGDEPHVVDDWDSVGVLCEPAIVGATATVYPSSPDGRIIAATVEQTDAFLRSYERARGRTWSPEEEQVCWAAGLWVITYNAKKETLGGGTGYVDHLSVEVKERLDRAGA